MKYKTFSLEKKFFFWCFLKVAGMSPHVIIVVVQFHLANEAFATFVVVILGRVPGHVETENGIRALRLERI